MKQHNIPVVLQNIIKDYLFEKKNQYSIENELTSILNNTYELLINNNIYKTLFDNKYTEHSDINFLELSKYPDSYYSIKNILNTDNYSLNKSNIFIRECISDIPKYSFWENYINFINNIQKYDTDCIIIKDFTDIDEIDYSSQIFLNMISNKYFLDTKINLNDIIKKYKLHVDCYLIHETNFFTKLCGSENNIILNYVKKNIKYYMENHNKKYIFVNLLKNKNPVSKQILLENFTTKYDTPIFDEKIKEILLTSSDTYLDINTLFNTPEENYLYIKYPNPKNTDIILKNIETYGSKYFRKHFSLLCKNPYTIDLVKVYLDKDISIIKPFFNHIFINRTETLVENLLLNPSIDEKVYENILYIYCKIIEYINTPEINIFVFCRNEIISTVKKIFHKIQNPYIFNYIIDNNIIFDTNQVISCIKDNIYNEYVDILKKNLLYNRYALEFIQKYDIWNIIDINFISTNPSCIKLLTTNIF